jgi:ABC-type antimicrobial peptide transport system permease subunit
LKHFQNHYLISGDLEEAFQEMIKDRGLAAACLWYWIQSFCCFYRYLINRLFWRLAMFKNYFKIVLRQMNRQKGYSFINISGLAIGMACCIIILLWVQDELSYDRFHENADHIYRVNKIWRKGEIAHYATTPAPLAKALKEEFPEINNSARFDPAGQMIVAHEKTTFYENNGAYADQSFFKLFTFPFVKGDPGTALSNPSSIVITENMADKYFGTQDAIGKTLRINNQYDFVVTGIMKNLPSQSHMQFVNFFVPFTRITEIQGRGQKTHVDWHNTAFYNYVLLQKNIPYQDVSEKISGYLKKHIPESTSSLYLQPLKRIHLYSSNLRLNIATGNITNIYIFSTMAFFILLIACINFMNLATARSGRRLKEIGMRKVLGASRGNLARQFFSESVILSFQAIVLAIAIVCLVLPVFNTLSGKNISIDVLFKIKFILGIVCIAFLTGLLSGSYPALFLSSFQPVIVLKSTIHTGLKRANFRKVLVIFQFFLMIILVIGTIVIYNQLKYIQNSKLGFDKEHLIFLPMNDDVRWRYEPFKNDLLQNPEILNVSASSSLPFWGTDIATEDVNWEGKIPGEDFLMRGVGVDYGFIETFRIEMAEGRNFSREFSTDQTNYILNNRAVEVMKLQSPLGKQLTLMGNTGSIIGIVKDYHFKPLNVLLEPLVLRLYEPQWLNFIYVRIQPENISRILKYTENQWKQYYPGIPFQYSFVDQALANIYVAVERIGVLFRYFTILAIVVACLGLFGLSAHIAEQRFKEISVRKVLGASISGIVFSLTKDFTRWILIANGIAWPVAYIVIGSWLQSFAYRVEINLWTFAIAGMLSVFIAVITVSYQSVRAATANPLDTLRYE